MNAKPIVVAGAGNIGCFLGGWLAAAGVPVLFLGRPRVVQELTTHGISLTDCDGNARAVRADTVRAGMEPSLLSEAGMVLVTVKSGATEDLARQIAQHAPTDAPVVSLQNGVGNVSALKSVLTRHRVVAGMVGFNVVALGEGRFHRGTGGDLVIEAGDPWPGRVFAEHGMSTRAHADMQSVAWGKLLINLNNALNALSGLPLAQQLADRGWRRILAQCMGEALAALRMARIEPESATPISPRMLPWVLRSPDWLYRRVARRQLQIDPKARSSMSDDLERRRITEIGFLQGAVVQLATDHGLSAPVNQRIVELIHAAESRAQGSPRMAPGQVWPANRQAS